MFVKLPEPLLGEEESVQFINQERIGRLYEEARQLDVANSKVHIMSKMRGCTSRPGSQSH